MYRETLKTRDFVEKSKLSQEQISTKVNRVCDAFLAILEKAEYRDGYLQNIITSHVCKVPPALEAGLQMIGRLQCGQPSPTCFLTKLTTIVASDDALTDKAAEHICFLADVNQLYDTALGLYNLDLALLIAQQSQKVRHVLTPVLCLANTMAGSKGVFASSTIAARRATYPPKVQD